MNGAYGEGLAAMEVVREWADATWPWAIAIVAFCAAGYIVGGILQRG